MNNQGHPQPVIGVLFPGDMGGHLGGLLVEQGRRVVTTVIGRSPRTARRATEAGLEVLPSLEAVVASADVLLSLVPPGAAVAVARQCRSLVSAGRALLFVDLNSISPETAGQVEAALAGPGITFVDGAVHGVASQLRERGVVYLSGPEAPAAAAQFGKPLRVKIVSERTGDASALRMMFSGLTKGLVALFLEMALAARQAGFAGELLSCYRETYPDLMSLLERLLPSYPAHARRRGDELREVEQTMRSLGVEPCVVTAARKLISDIGRLNLADRDWSTSDIIETLFSRIPLQAERETPFAPVSPHVPVQAVSSF